MSYNVTSEMSSARVFADWMVELPSVGPANERVWLDEMIVYEKAWLDEIPPDETA